MALNQEIQMIPLNCSKLDHQGGTILGLCLRVGCENPPAQCYKCTLQLHKECNAFTKTMDEVPNLLQSLWQKKFQLIQLQQSIISHTSELITSIEKILKPISLYIETPNMVNLNNLGFFLKQKMQIENLEQVISGICFETFQKINILVGQEISFMINLSASDWKNEGNILARQKKYEEAIAYYSQAFKIDPNDSDLLNNKGCALAQLKKYEEALECYSQSLKINPNDSQTWKHKERYEEALEFYSQALKIDPNLSSCWNNKGIALKELDKYEEALECYSQALKIDPNFSYAWYNKGIALNNLNKYEEAYECFSEALKIDPSNKVIETNYKRLKEYLNK